MAILALSNNERISSIEISELTNKNHAHIMRDIRNLIEQGVSESNFGLGSYSDKNNQTRPMYLLTKKGSLILASGYDALLREKIIDRWEELELKEKEIASQIPSNFAQALRLAAQQAEELERQQALLKEQAPKVLFADAVSASDKDILIGELSTFIQQNGVKNLGQNKLFAYLRQHNYLCSSGERYNLPTQRAIDLEIFRVKVTSINQANGKSIISCTTKVTPKGQLYFINKFLSKEVINNNKQHKIMETTEKRKFAKLVIDEMTDEIIIIHEDGNKKIFHEMSQAVNYCKENGVMAYPEDAI